jgi:hypothetical protein
VNGGNQLRDQLLALMNFPKLDMPNYSTVVTRIGRMLADGAPRSPSGRCR